MSQLRAARPDDIDEVAALWRLLWDEIASDVSAPWLDHAREWFAVAVEDPSTAWIPVISSAGRIVATATGTVELGVPNPFSVRGRAVRLANVITLPEHRGRGYASMLVEDVVAWAKTVHADRIDLTATAEGQRVYERLGFTVPSSPRMKLAL